jgi:hypothetical protein
MGYRNQPTSVSGVKDVSDKGPTFQDRALLENEKREAERKRLADINKKREESNWRIEQEESLYSADLQAGIRTAANKTNVDYTSLNDSMSNMVSQLSAARIRLKQSSGPYEEMDPEGNVVFNTQTDKSYIKSATDFIKNSETNFGSVAYIQEEFKKMPSGNGEGETSRKFTSPYLGLLNAASNPASGQDVSVSYDMEYDNKSGHRMGIVMKGEAVRRLNAEMGNEGDTYTIKPEEVTNLMMGNNDPENFGLFYQNPSTVSELEKKAATNGILDDGAINSDYMIEVKTEEPIVDELTGTEQMATVSQVNYPVIKQNMAGAIKSKLMTTLDKGMVSTSVLINTYAKQDEDGNYYYDTPRKDGNGNIIYKADGKVDFGSVNEDGDTRNRVYLGDGELEFDMSSDNESFGGLSEDDYKNVYGLIENEFMKRSGVYDPQVVKPYGEKMTVERKTARNKKPSTDKQTEGSLKRGRITGTINDFIRNVELAKKENAFNPETLDKTRLDNVAELISGVYGGGEASYDAENKLFIVKKPAVYDEDGIVVTKGETISLEYDPSAPNASNRLRQKLESSLGTTSRENEERITIGKSSPQEVKTEREREERSKRNRFESKFPVLKDDNGNMLEETKLVTELRKQFQDITFKEEEPGSDAISINGIKIKGSDYNPEAIMDIVYEQLNPTETKDTEETVEATGVMKQFSPKKKVETGNNQTVVQEEEPVAQELVVQKEEPVAQKEEPVAQVVKKTTTNPPNTKSNKREEEQESFLLDEEVTGGGINGNEVAPLPQYKNSKAAYNYLNSKTQVKMGSGGDGRAAEYGDKNKKMGLKVDIGNDVWSGLSDAQQLMIREQHFNLPWNPKVVMLMTAGYIDKADRGAYHTGRNGKDINKVWDNVDKQELIGKLKGKDQELFNEWSEIYSNSEPNEIGFQKQYKRRVENIAKRYNLDLSQDMLDTFKTK